MRPSGSFQGDTFLATISQAYLTRNTKFLVQNLENPIALTFNEIDHPGLTVLELIPDILEKIQVQTDLNLYKMSYLCAIYLLQMIIDHQEMDSENQNPNYVDPDSRLFCKRLQDMLVTKDTLFNQIFKDLCQQDEVGATLKVCLITECFLHNDTFVNLDKRKVQVIYKVLTMTLQDPYMTLVLGPRALQCLSLIILRNKKARKLFTRTDVIKDFVRCYIQTEQDKEKRLKLFLVAKQMLPLEESKTLAQELNLERSLLQCKNYDSISFFLSRIPFKQMTSFQLDKNVANKSIQDISAVLFTGDDNTQSGKGQWYSRLKLFNRTADGNKKSGIQGTGLNQSAFLEDTPTVTSDNRFQSNYDESVNCQDFSMEVRSNSQGSQNYLPTQSINQSFHIPANSTQQQQQLPNELTQKDLQLIQEARAQHMSANSTGGSSCCGSNNSCLIM